jgi:hypothetical protein
LIPGSSYYSDRSPPQLADELLRPDLCRVEVGLLQQRQVQEFAQAHVC